MSYETKAFPATEPIIHDGMNLVDYFACHSPQPSDEEIKREMLMDKQINPHNESHKPKLRDKVEIECYLRFKWAAQMMKEREQWI